MANGLWRGGNREKARPPDHVVQEFVPSSAWTEDSDGYSLLVNLPGFKNEEVKLQVDIPGRMKVSGERLVGGNKYVYFEKTYTIAENSDTEKIEGNFNGNILYITIPKKPAETRKEPKSKQENVKKESEMKNKTGSGITKDSSGPEKPSSNENSNKTNEEEKEKSKKTSHVDGFSEETLKKWGREATPLEKAMEMVKKNKDILLAVVLTFSLGVSFSRFFQKPGR